VRARRIRGQVEALERALTEEQDCGDILRLIKRPTVSLKPSSPTSNEEQPYSILKCPTVFAYEPNVLEDAYRRDPRSGCD
jgi:hypothetical protein